MNAARPDPAVWRRATGSLQLADNLCGISRSLREVRRSHVSRLGAFLPIIFMSEVLAHVEACVSARAARNEAGLGNEIGDILFTLERGMIAGNREARAVITTFFAWDPQCAHGCGVGLHSAAPIAIARVPVRDEVVHSVTF